MLHWKLNTYTYPIHAYVHVNKQMKHFPGENYCIHTYLSLSSPFFFFLFEVWTVFFHLKYFLLFISSCLSPVLKLKSQFLFTLVYLITCTHKCRHADSQFNNFFVTFYYYSLYFFKWYFYFFPLSLISHKLKLLLSRHHLFILYFVIFCTRQQFLFAKS